MAGAALDRVLSRLHGVKAISGQFAARCPAHDDHIQSLTIKERHDLSVLLHCHAGCDKTAILDALGLKFADLYVDTSQKQLVATYDYKNLDGTKLLYQAVRYFPKEFRMRRPDPLSKGGWSWDLLPLKGKHVAYRLPDVRGHNQVVVVEGEKDADRLWQSGIAATTNIGGAEKWTASDTQSLVQAGVSDVVIIPDNDDPGRRHAERVLKSAQALHLSARVLELDHLPPHGDVSIWLMNGGTPEQLLHLLSPVSVAVPALPPAPPANPFETGPPADALDVTDYFEHYDVGAADSFRDRYRDQLRFDHQRKKWLLWSEHFWRPDADAEALRLADTHVRLLQRDALYVPDFSRRKACLDYATARQKRGPLLTMLSMAEHVKPFAVDGGGWDRNPWLLGCPNGVVDLQAGQFRHGQHDDLITLNAGCAYDPDATCPRWEQFLTEVFDGDADLVDYIWRAIGYSLTGDMREQCFFVGFGSGANGKSIFLDTLETVLGTYAHRADMRLFAGFASDVNNFQVADLRGRRLVFAAEVKPGSRMNEHILKHLTGGETLRGEHKYENAFTFRPVGKIWLGVNHRPKVADDSFGFWRRVRLIPFERTFAGTAEDRTLRSTLKAEAPGILSWAVRGTLQWIQRGLTPPAVVEAATEEYQRGEDPLADFFESRIEVVAESIVPFHKLYQAYRDWAGTQGIRDSDKMSAKMFGNMMQTRPFMRSKINNVVCYKGLEVRTPLALI